jgi:hypothetical protein
MGEGNQDLGMRSIEGVFSRHMRTKQHSMRNVALAKLFRYFPSRRVLFPEIENL